MCLNKKIKKISTTQQENYLNESVSNRSDLATDISKVVKSE